METAENTNKVHYRPRPSKTEGYFSDENITILSNAITFNQPVLLQGESGTGKSTIVRCLARQKGVEVVRIDGSGNLTEDEIIGCQTLEPGEGGMPKLTWKDGFLTDCVRHGKWLILEEINGIKPSVRLSLHSILEDTGYLTLHTGDKVFKHPDFRFFATMNPPSIQYTGTQRDNFAFKDRFIPIPISYLDAETETELLLEYFGYGEAYYAHEKIKEVISTLCEYASSQRERYANGDGIEFPLTTRKLIQLIQHAHTMNFDLVFDQFMRGISDKASAKAMHDQLVTMISPGSTDDVIFKDSGKTIPSTDLTAAIEALEDGVHETKISGSSPTEAIINMGKDVDYFKVAYNFSYEDVVADEELSEFDALCIESARDFMIGRGYLK